MPFLSNCTQRLRCVSSGLVFKYDNHAEINDERISFVTIALYLCIFFIDNSLFIYFPYPPPPPLSLSLSLSVSLTSLTLFLLSPSLSISISYFLSLSVCLCLSLSLSPSLFISLSPSLFISISYFLSLSPSGSFEGLVLCHSVYLFIFIRDSTPVFILI